MEKTKTTKAKSTNKSNASAQKKIEKKAQTLEVKTENKNEIDYPSWTIPEHLNEKDHKDLKRVYELYKEGKFELALSFASDFDTIVREQIPSDIWKEIGGTLTPKGEKELQNNEEKQETEEEFEEKEEPKSEQVNEEIIEESKSNEENVEEVKPLQKEIQKSLIQFQNPYVFKDDKLFALTEEYLIKTLHINEAKFYAKNDMEEFIIQNHKTLFGENTVIIDNTKNTNEYFPNVFLFDFNDKEKPRMYVVEVNLQDDSLGLLYARITHFLASLRHKDYQYDFLVELYNVINENEETKTELKNWVNEEQEISGLLSSMLDNKPAILLVKDNDNVVLDLMQAVYVETWGKMVRQILVKKYRCNGDTIYNVNPVFTDIWRNGKQKTEETIKVSENDHLCELPDRVRNIYRSIKTALLEVDSSLEFNSKKHYISIRKNKNLAFLQLKRKLVDIVVMNEEESTRELIKYHRIKTLPPSVQKFWNGDCCTIVVENSDNLDEVIELLKMVVTKI